MFTHCAMYQYLQRPFYCFDVKLYASFHRLRHPSEFFSDPKILYLCYWTVLSVSPERNPAHESRKRTFNVLRPFARPSRPGAERTAIIPAFPPFLPYAICCADIRNRIAAAGDCFFSTDITLT